MTARGSSAKLPRFRSEEPRPSDDPEESADANIVVAVRVRGLLPQEITSAGRSCLLVEGSSVIVKELESVRTDDYLRVHKSRERSYGFNFVFDADSETSTIYDATVSHLVGAVIKGFNATVFAYGATGAGKTHTMLGSESKPSGIMTLALNDLFTRLRQNENETKFRIKCSFLEVYNENIYDLLSDQNKNDMYLDLREDSQKGIFVNGLSEWEDISNASQIMSLLHKGNKNRTREPTCANQVSSRSHAVFSVTLEQRPFTADVSHDVEIGKLSMIDLAGSERASATNNRGIRLLEGANINRSLLSLANCITALSDRNAFVPYRDSKLTRLLKDSLGGNCRTVMIANVSPCHHSYEDSHNTLKYAHRANSIKTKATKNVVSVNYHATKYTKIIQELRNEISQLKSKISRRPK